MTKTLETLFHLANFMKYLLNDVLPNEKSSTPQYVLGSLMDLLQTILECINNVRDKTKKNQNKISQLQETFHGLIESEAGESILQAQRDNSALKEQEKQQKLKNMKMDQEVGTILPTKEESAVPLYSPSERNENNQLFYRSIQEENCVENDRNIDNCEATKRILIKEEENSVPQVLEQNIRKEQFHRPILKESYLEMEKYVDLKATDDTIFLLKEEADCLNTIKKKKLPKLSMQTEIEQSTERNCVTSEEPKTIKVSKKYVKKQDQLERFGLEMKKNINLDSLGNYENHSQDFSRDKETLRKISLGSGIVTRHQSIIINKNFIFLHEQIASGFESFGAFCLSCDKGFFSASDWHFHTNDDYKHLKMPCKEISCEQCDFFICGNSIVLEVYLDFHAKSHNAESTKIEEANHSLSELSKIPIIRSQSEHLKDIPKEQFISSSFVEVHTKLITNAFNEGYYCENCDNIFFSNIEWLQHLQDCHCQEVKEAQINQCNICSLVIFSTPETGRNLFSYHYKAHESKNSLVCCEITQPQTNLRSSFQNLSKVSDTVSTLSRTSSSLELNQQLNNSNVHQNAGARRARQNNRKELVFSDNFILLNKEMQKGKVTEAYYCRPCDKVYYSLKDWEMHCLTKRHTAFMQNRKFNNTQAVCQICNMTIIGAKNVIIGYIKYHSAGHDGVPSYEIKLISNDDHSQAKPVDCLNSEGSHIDQSFQGNNTSKTEIEPTISSNEIHDEKTTQSCEDNSWFHQDLIGRIKALFLDKKKKKLSGKSLAFHAFCLACDCEIEDAFEWMDHLELDLHYSKVRKNDEELNYEEFNINIFGNKSLIAEALP